MAICCGLPDLHHFTLIFSCRDSCTARVLVFAVRIPTIYIHHMAVHCIASRLRFGMSLDKKKERSGVQSVWRSFHTQTSADLGDGFRASRDFNRACFEKADTSSRRDQPGRGDGDMEFLTGLLVLNKMVYTSFFGSCKVCTQNSTKPHPRARKR